MCQAENTEAHVQLSLHFSSFEVNFKTEVLMGCTPMHVHEHTYTTLEKYVKPKPSLGSGRDSEVRCINENSKQTILFVTLFQFQQRARGSTGLWKQRDQIKCWNPQQK